MPALLGIALYMLVQFGLGVWISRRVRTESDYILAGRKLGYGLCTFSIFATWFGAETVMGSAGLAYRDGVSLASAEPFGYGLCLVLMGLVFAAPLWKRQFTTLADLYRERYSIRAERLAAVVLIPSSILWAAAQIRAFGYVITTSSTVDAGVATAVAAGLTVMYAAFGGMLVDAITDLVQGGIVVIGLVVLLAAVLPNVAELPLAAGTTGSRVTLVPADESPLSMLERWAIPVAGSVIATELVARALAARSAVVARRSFLIGGGMYVAIGAIPLFIGLAGPAIMPNLADPEQLIPELARSTLPPLLYVLFAGALLSAILSTVDSTLLVSSALLSHNVIVPIWRVSDERTKVRVARAVVVLFGALAYLLATRAEGVFELVEQASAFGSAGALVTAIFGLFTGWGGSRAAIATLLAGVLTYVSAVLAGFMAPFLLSLAASLLTYLVVAAWETMFPSVR